MVAESTQEFFSKLSRNPADLNMTDVEMVKQLAEKYPYAQLLQFAKKKLGNEPEEAAIFASERSLLGKFMMAPERLSVLHSGELPAPQAENLTVEEEPDELILEPMLSVADEENSAVLDETQQLILESIAAADFFALEDKVSEPFVSETISQEVSRYDDDQLPYSFLWWLNKTRKEHADTYQPYVSFKLDTSQQIKASSPANEAVEKPIADFDLALINTQNKSKNIKTNRAKTLKTKEDELVERFILEEPQISPPSADKMGTENKARKSAEDSLDVVSETLAQIYTEQMLLDKAIETYRKLSLKFPEKSTYFTDQISLLERKKN